jgi:Rieske Fe-S protein
VEPPHGDDRPHVPPPSLWPVGFAVGIVCILVGLIVSWPAAAAGVAITLLFGFLWIRDAARDYRTPPATAEAEAGAEPAGRPAPAIPAGRGEAALPAMDEEEIERFPRSRFLEGATLGIGAVIGGIVTVPALGFAVLPAFTGEERDEVELGPISEFPENQWIVAKFLLDPEAGEVSARTAYIRNNGTLNGKPSFTVLSNRCVHLGCPVQPNALLPEKEPKAERMPGGGEVQLIRPISAPSGFGCPCHGGQYDNEGNRTAGPPVRALDRYDFAIREGRLFLGNPYSVAYVEGEGKEARMKRYGLSGPGEHVDGIESWLYPLQPSDL